MGHCVSQSVRSCGINKNQINIDLIEIIKFCLICGGPHLWVDAMVV